jgi:trimeric autotransporter adhesin
MSAALSAGGAMLAVGASEDPSASIGFDGDQADRTAPSAGSAFVFTRFGEGWEQFVYIKAPNADDFDGFGRNVALSATGTSLAVGAYGEASAATGVGGDQHDESAQSAGAAYVTSLVPLIALAPHE